MKCTYCSEELAENRPDCPSCGQPNGAPNVRRASRPDEQLAFAARVRDARTSGQTRGISAELSALENAINGSSVVISRPILDVQLLCKGTHFSYASFARQVRAGTRAPNATGMDNVRAQFENALFPNYHEDIIFGSLTITDRGLKGYGEVDIILKDKMIELRASVFEENPYNFGLKQRLGLSDEIPAGYRAPWPKRGELGVAKLHGSIQKGMTLRDFDKFLQNDNGGTGDSDFIEAHIYGTFNIRAIRKVVTSLPKNREDQLLWRKLTRDLESAGVETETR